MYSVVQVAVRGRGSHAHLRSVNLLVLRRLILLPVSWLSAYSTEGASNSRAEFSPDSLMRI